MSLKLFLCFIYLLPCILWSKQDAYLTTHETDSLEYLADQYAELGDYLNSLRLIRISYQKNIEQFSRTDERVIRSLVKLAAAESSAFKLTQARTTIEAALEQISTNSLGNTALEWEARAVNAFIYENEGQNFEAGKAYEQYFQLVKKDPSIFTTKFHVEALIRMGVFYSNQYNPDKAYIFTDLAYSHAIEGDLKNSITHIKAIHARAFVHMSYLKYEKAIAYSKEGLELLRRMKNETPLESVKVEGIKPRLVFTKVFSQYGMLDNPQIATLENLVQDCKEAIAALDTQKSLLTYEQGTNLLLAYNRRPYSFLKVIYFDLYNKTGNIKYVNNILELHESYSYNRIRSHLKGKDIEFSNVPNSIRVREEVLSRNFLNAIIYGDAPIGLGDTATAWQSFLDSLKINYPNYHNFKYGSIVQSLDNLRQQFPKETTLIRYLYISSRLFVCLVGPKGTSIQPLPFIDLSVYQQELEKSSNTDQVGLILYELYKRLWAPIADKVTTKKVIIVPDRELFNLSFELLTPTRVNSFEELAQQSLLTKHTISYNYSLFLLEKNKKILELENGFVAYAPAFNQQMKKDYKLAITDSTDADKAYLTLLPQPFSSELAVKFAKKFQGSSFLNEKASKQVFSRTAKEHKIIHIGTHAEADNSNPELSRLVFAKDVTDTTALEDNYLYTYEIYNQDLSSNLAILTACETGKPTFQPGEGMISLAHAFNYAGSKSILTSLWSIDEESSTQIVSHFYEFLEKGLAKDEALRQAKLKYLENAYDEALSPQYWAGLILMGDTSPIELHSGVNWWLWILVGFFAGFFILLFLKKRKTSHSS